MGKSIAACERLLPPSESRFDQSVGAILNGEYTVADQILTGKEIAGLKLFSG